ncbi:hypothetical protein EIP86_010559 [Pleurotus ostreatoroseus]|nr:hypothetical protein EIP86_010559 [Pleurotus ostreatoroseus]
MSTRDNGLTLIPPPLLSFVETFASDIRELFPSSSTRVYVTKASSLHSVQDYVFFTLSSETSHTFADGSPTTEGYEMDITSKGVTIRGSGSKGAFWATRTLLQGLVLGDGRFPNGVISDQPDWETRGIMLDVGRHWYPISFLKEVCAYASWFKMSEFHVHLSDNVNPQGHPDAYARFRLRAENPEFSGLAPHVNETYSRAEFDDFQQTCAARGVTPGHALVITQWKPELALSGNPTLINLTVPDAIPTIKSIWKEYLPWIHSKQVSIGADEYDEDLADDYNNFVNTMSEFIGQEANKTIRIWSTLEPSNRTSVSKRIIKQHWDFSDGDPFGLIHEGYNVINSEDSVQYIVVKDAVWNDHGPNGSTVLEAFYTFKEGLPVVAAANWQAASRPGHLTHTQFLQAYPILEAVAPGQNLDRRVPSKGPVVVSYDLPTVPTADKGSGVVKDKSGNGYNAVLEDGVLRTPLGSKGHNYTLRVVTDLPDTETTLLSGPDSSFGTARSTGGLTLAFTSDNITYPLLNYTLPSRISPSTELIVKGTENRTSVWVNAKFAGDFVISLDGTEVYMPMAFVAPVKELGGRSIKIQQFTLWNGPQEISEISEYK